MLVINWSTSISPISPRTESLIRLRQLMQSDQLRHLTERTSFRSLWENMENLWEIYGKSMGKHDK